MKKLLACILLSLLLVAGAAATTVVPMTVEDLTRQSQLVVRAEAVTSWSEWNAEQTIIYTYTRFRVRSAWKGEADREIVVRQMGGVADGFQQKVAGVRSWERGEQTVLFLRKASRGEARQQVHLVTGLMQGDFRVHAVEGRLVASNGAPDAHSFDPQTRTLKTYKGARLTLHELEQRVRKAVQQ